MSWRRPGIPLVCDVISMGFTDPQERGSGHETRVSLLLVSNIELSDINFVPEKFFHGGM